MTLPLNPLDHPDAEVTHSYFCQLAGSLEDQRLSTRAHRPAMAQAREARWPRILQSHRLQALPYVSSCARSVVLTAFTLSVMREPKYRRTRPLIETVPTTIAHSERYSDVGNGRRLVRLFGDSTAGHPKWGGSGSMARAGVATWTAK